MNNKSVYKLYCFVMLYFFVMCIITILVFSVRCLDEKIIPDKFKIYSQLGIQNALLIGRNSSTESFTKKTINDKDNIIAELTKEVERLEKLTEETIYITIRENFERKFEELGMLTSSSDKYNWYLEYKKMLTYYDSLIDMPETIYDCLSTEEIAYLCRMVETETYGQNFMSKVHVANVALNRLESGKFGSDMKAVITSPMQFVYSRTKISNDTLLAVEYAFEISDETNGSTYFHSGSYTSVFNGAKYVMTDDCGHHFYRKEY